MASTDEKRDEKPLGMKKILRPVPTPPGSWNLAKRATWPEIQAFWSNRRGDETQQLGPSPERKTKPPWPLILKPRWERLFDLLNNNLRFLLFENLEMNQTLYGLFLFFIS
jgi:hypothetical protein